MEHEEYKIHLAIVKHHYSAFPHVKLLYIPNAVRSSSDAFFNKMMGAQPGAHDLFIFWKKLVGIGIAIYEVKSRKGRLSTAQNKFASGMATLGAHTSYGSSVKHYHNFLVSCGITPKHNACKEPDLRTFDEKKSDAFDLYKPIDN